MPHIFFFGYASENLDTHLKGFFEDLCEEVAPLTKWAATDLRIGFRDKEGLPLMSEWEPRIVEALQSSCVLVCITSPAYFAKKFCGQEYWLFDQRRRQDLQSGVIVPPVVLPVLWVPYQEDLPNFIDKIQWGEGDMPDLYQTKGLRYLKKFDRNQYDACVSAFAEAIVQAWKKYVHLPRLAMVPPFEQIPNAFAGGAWEEAAGVGGWLSGPGVANFVFVAARAQEIKAPAGRHGDKPANWRPFLPPVPRTISEIARAATSKHSLLYREILADHNLPAELEGARDRKNLTLVVADAQSLSVPGFESVKAFDGDTWEGASLLVPWNDLPAQWDGNALPQVTASFPIRSQLKPPAFRAPIQCAEDLDALLDITIADLRSAVTKAGTEKKAKTDDAPPQIVGPGQAGA